MNAMDSYQRGFKDGFAAAKELIAPVARVAPAPEPVTELPEAGQGMPSDADMLLYATPFFETDADKAAQAAIDDAEEGEK